MNKIELAPDTITQEELLIISEWLKTNPKLTQGSVVEEFQSKFSSVSGKIYSTMVNSGSSAILLSLYALKQQLNLINVKVAVPTVSWVTDVSSVMQLGMEPVLVDCNLDNFSVDLNDLERCFRIHKPNIYIHVHVLGLANDIKSVSELCRKYNVLLIEDCCELLPSDGITFRYPEGSYGLISLYSLYFGHHMSTIEGGMVCTNSKEIDTLLKSLRNHGWTRNLDHKTKEKFKREWKTSEFKEKYTFYLPGFNLRATDLQAKIGLLQLKNLTYNLTKRQTILETYDRLLNNPKPYQPRPAFAYPIMIDYPEKLWAILNHNNIESRPLIAGSMGNQPFWISKYGKQEFKNADKVDRNGMYVPIHPGMSLEDVTKVCDIIKEYANSIYYRSNGPGRFLSS
jgi:CDP-4-dehydro-6-deoxyglucose reductase, E1